MTTIYYDRPDDKSSLRLYDDDKNKITEIDHSSPLKSRRGIIIEPDVSDVDGIDVTDRTLRFERIKDTDE